MLHLLQSLLIHPLLFCIFIIVSVVVVVVILIRIPILIVVVFVVVVIAVVAYCLSRYYYCFGFCHVYPISIRFP